MTLKNLYNRREVAKDAGKPCFICHAKSSVVLITDADDDWFYICQVHLSNPQFATAKDAKDVEERKRQAELDKEIEAVKKEFEEKMKRKMERRKQKEYEKEGKKDKAGKKEEGKEDAEDEKAKEAKLQELEAKKDPEKAKADDGPKIFELHKSFFGMRVQKKRQEEVAKRNRERLRAQGGLPSVPQGFP